MTPPETTSRPIAATELRRAFLDFFAARGHTVVPSAPLVTGDPTLLFTTAGMVQFKHYYTTGGDVPYARAVSIQKCLRLTDLERVGLTPRHDTFFEMLGNFSFGARERGAYFKEEAIAFAWEFVTRVLGLPIGRLYASIFEGEGNLPRDDEAEALWKKIGLPADHIVPLGRADNFWGPAGGQGACGPCSEIYFDLGERRPPDLPPDAFWGDRPGDPGDRYMEFWNLVFPQFDAQPDGRLVPLPRPGIDTGMGIERLAMIMQGKTSIFETDLFSPLVERILKISEDEYGETIGPTHIRDARIVADHARASAFAMAESVVPGSGGAGYVLRRLLRRAEVVARSRAGLRVTGTEFLSQVIALVISSFRDAYPELQANSGRIIEIVDREEMMFLFTYGRGLTFIEDVASSGRTELSGAEAFKLHDTYGFPVDVAEELLKARGISLDRDAFAFKMEEQRQRARQSSRLGGSGKTDIAIDWTCEGSDHEQGATAFDRDMMEMIQVRLIRWRELPNRELELVLDKTPFYPESGGQVSDKGQIGGLGVRAEVIRVYRENDEIVHRVRFIEGPPSQLITSGRQSLISAVVSREHREGVRRHHTATHLLHAVLRHVLGTHVHQAGSLVAPDRLRFDYTHIDALSKDDIARIEHLVNIWVLRDVPVDTRTMELEKARDSGAMALFGEKYGALVRVVSVEGVEEASIPESRELCGGTHVGRTGEIGLFVLLTDSAIGSGVRRIEGLCGQEVLREFRWKRDLLERAAQVLQSGIETLPEQIEKLKGELERLRKEAADARRGGLEAEMMQIARDARAAPQGRWIVAEIASDADTNAVRDAADRLRGALQRGAAVLAVTAGGKVTFVTAVTDDLVSEKKLRADEVVRAVAKIAGGSGGGKPHLALAGAKDPSKLEAALAEARRLLEEALA